MVPRGSVTTGMLLAQVAALTQSLQQKEADITALQREWKTEVSGLWQGMRQAPTELLNVGHNASS